MTLKESAAIAPARDKASRVNLVRFEHSYSALGVGTQTPRVSWQVSSDDPRWAQTAYEAELDGADRIRVESSEQVLVPWPFEPLASRGRASVRIRVACGDVWTGWSEPSIVEIGLLTPEDWVGRFISPRAVGAVSKAAPILSRTVALQESVASARLYATAHGLYTATVNGERVSNDLFTPGWTSYYHRLQYQTYDVSSMLHKGINTVEVLLGNGWYRGGIGLPARPARYGERLAFLAQLEVTYVDGSVEIIATDEQWSATESGIMSDDLYDGQRTDLRSRVWPVDKVDVLDANLNKLVATEVPPVRITDVLSAVTLWESSPGRTIVDFGQNLVGWVRLRVREMKAGDEITIRHSELLENGELCVRTLGSAKATDAYILDNTAEVVLEPSLTFHGFRYAEITGVDNVLPDDIEAVVIGSDLRRTGWFSCSDRDLERLHDNVVWSMRGNFLSIPTDCPQRSERLGWTGDLQVFAPTASFLFDVGEFLRSWLTDLTADQHADGSVPWVIPDVLHADEPAACAWGDAATFVPWVLYQRFGDVEILAQQFASMRAWVDKIVSLTKDSIWAGGFQFGDWLDPTAPPDSLFEVKADPDVVATAHLIRSAEIVAEAAQVLGQDTLSHHYARLASDTRTAFVHEYVTGSGRVFSDAATVYAIAIEWALLPTEAQREHAGQRLAHLVRASGFRAITGFVGTPLVADALCSSGHPDLAHRMLLEKGCPSWLYPVTMGATTIWERLNAILPDGSINTGGMPLSFNHYAFGAVADWLHRTVAGIAPGSPGYREIIVRPIPNRALSYATARHLTPYGEASVAWRRHSGQFDLEVAVPVGARATVHVPGIKPVAVKHGQHTWSVADPCTTVSTPVSTVRELLDSPELWSGAVDILASHGFGKDAADLAGRAAPYFDFPPTQLPLLLSSPLNLERGGATKASAAFKALLA